jgi:hypothetical protein
MPYVRTLFWIFSMMATMVDCTCASSLPIDPVESMQKQMSMNPKAGSGSYYRDFALKIVAFEGF